MSFKFGISAVKGPTEVLAMSLQQWIATVEAHCGGAVYSIRNSGLDEMDDCTVDMLLPPSVKWKCWRLADCTEYDVDNMSGACGESGAEGESGSESNKGCEDHHDGETQELVEDGSWSGSDQ